MPHFTPSKLHQAVETKTLNNDICFLVLPFSGWQFAKFPSAPDLRMQNARKNLRMLVLTCFFACCPADLRRQCGQANVEVLEEWRQPILRLHPTTARESDSRPRHRPASLSPFPNYAPVVMMIPDFGKFGSLAFPANKASVKNR